jgi:hypothetical protein
MGLQADYDVEKTREALGDRLEKESVPAPRSTVDPLHRALCDLSVLCGNQPEDSFAIESTEDTEGSGAPRCAWRTLWQS